MEKYLDKKEDFIYFLRYFAGYDYMPSQLVEPFLYQDVDSPELKRLREELSLDKVSGTGSQWERLLRLNHWLHETITHDGSSTFPHPLESLRILQVCKDEGRGVNCRLLATVLNDLCLALGWKSRFVSCTPIGEDYKDNHVVTTVFIDEWSKWVFVDPTWDAYVKDSNGRVLNLDELRTAYITGERLQVSEGINWNGKPGDADEYLAYMAKNTFRFAANARSEYGAESKSEITQYWLHPIGYHPTNTVREKQFENRLIRRIYISDPVFFWGVI